MPSRPFTPDEQRSYRAHFVLSGAALIGVLVWALVDEVHSRRPYKRHQRDYLKAARQQGAAQIDSLPPNHWSSWKPVAATRH